MNLFFQHSENSGVGYYRIWQPAKWIQKNGLAEVKRLPDDCRNIPADIIDPKIGYSLANVINWADLLIFQRIDSFMGLAAIDTVINDYTKPVVLDLDDDLIHIDRRHPQYDVFRPKAFHEVYEVQKIRKEEILKYRGDKSIIQVGEDPADKRWLFLCRPRGQDIHWIMTKVMQSVSAITVTTELLAGVYRKINSNVYVLPNCMDFEITDALPKHKDKDNVVIGWAGGGQHIHDINLVVPALDVILTKYPQARFHWAGCKTKETDRLLTKHPKQTTYLQRTRIQDWFQKYAEWDFDIGLAPLWVNRFNSGKSNIKWLENSARKIPTVATRISCYEEIEDGETGFFALETQDWVKALSWLIENKAERDRVGDNAYDYCKANYNAKDNARKYINAYSEIIARHKVKKEANNAICI
ncbi:MAG: glycosyltransferase [Planctomycetota bacterium]